MIIRRSIFILILLIQASFCLAQLNVKVGYGFAYTPAETNNAMISDFNELNAFRLDRDMKDLHFISGLEIGLNYRFENIGFELSYDNLTTDTDALGEEANGDIFTDKLFYGLSGYSLAVENVWGKYGYGVALGRRRHKVQERIATTDEKRPIVQKTVNATKVYAIFQLGGTRSISFQIRPYVNIPWDALDLGSVRTNLDLAQSTNSMEKFVTYGISFAFYNGPQR